MLARGRAIMAFGLPGSGKRVQVDKLCGTIEKRGQTCQVIEVGKSLRAMTAARDSSIVVGSLAEVMHKGKLVPEIFPLYVLVKELIETPIADVVITDGFGRRLSELKMVLRLFEMIQYQIDTFLLDISASEAERRLLYRGRADDVPEVIDQRIRSHQKNTRISLRYLQRNAEQFRFGAIDGMGTVDEVHQRLLNFLCI